MLKYIVALVVGVLPAFSFAQINSIYSAYGIGDVDMRDWNAYSAMGGLGVALKSERTLNDLNPASYGGIKNNRFLLEVSAAGHHVNYVSADQNLSASYLGVKRAAFGMNLFKNLGTVVGIRQYSQVEYKSTADRYMVGTNTKLQENITGTGGLNLAYLGNGYNIGKHLSIGITAGMLFGSINKTEDISINSDEGISIQSNVFYNKFYFNSGIQYEFKTGKYKWLLGATFQPGMNLRKREDNYIKDGNDTTLLTADPKNTSFKYPLQYGAGITVSRGHHKLGVDYLQQNWSSTNYKGDNFTTTNHQNYAIGYSYSFWRKTIHGPVEGASLMLGLQQDDSYIIINGNRVSSTFGTFGANFPSKGGWFNYSLGMRVGQRGTVAYPIVKEKFVDFTLNVSLSNFFYIGGRKYD